MRVRVYGLSGMALGDPALPKGLDHPTIYDRAPIASETVSGFTLAKFNRQPFCLLSERLATQRQFAAYDLGRF